MQAVPHMLTVGSCSTALARPPASPRSLRSLRRVPALLKPPEGRTHCLARAWLDDHTQGAHRLTPLLLALRRNF